MLKWPTDFKLVGRESLGELVWLGKQSGIGICPTISLAQQAIANPTGKDLSRMNNTIKRAKQHADLCIVLKSLPVLRLGFAMNSDASLSNADKKRTQGGFIVAAVDKVLGDNLEAD